MTETPQSGNPSESSSQSGVDAESELDRLEVEQAWERAEQLRKAYDQWLERREIDPLSIPHDTMKSREFNLFRNVGIGSNITTHLIHETRRDYAIPEDVRYMWVETEPTLPDWPMEPHLVKVDENDFGTVISWAAIAQDYGDTSAGPFGPRDPASPEGTLRQVDISREIAVSSHELYRLAQELMDGKIDDPFNPSNGDFGVRAGEPASWQRDAYVWESSPFAKSVELTLAFPSMYASVCVVSGEKKEASNGKPGMAQIENPTVQLKIEGDLLKSLQEAYQKLYSEPNFALSDQQRQQRDSTFNEYFIGLISQNAQRNKNKTAATHTQLKARQLPY